MSYNRHLSRPEVEESPLHQLKATYWETKHKVMSKLGKNGDQHVQASDAELDAKIEVLKSVQRTTDQLMRLINEYEYVMFALAKNEHAFGRFLKTQSEVDKTRAGKFMAAVGRVETFSSQQRLGFRQPLERLYQECETFRLRAVTDTASNLEHMETARNDYRAALMWMKDVSEELDPDTHKQLDKFRKVQGQVRKKKDLFDRLKLDVMQKVDMLAASRANMFSRALEFYQKWLMEYWSKSARTLEVVSKGFSGMYHYYEFNVIKDLAEPAKLLAEKTGSKSDDDQTEAVIQELEALITELNNNGARDLPPPRFPQSNGSSRHADAHRDENTMPSGDYDDQKMNDLIGDFNDSATDDRLILNEEQRAAGGNESKPMTDLMSSDFFDIEKADGAMAELHKRQRERTMGGDNDEQLLLSLAGPAPQTEMPGQGGNGFAANEELKLLDELLSVMNQAVDSGKDISSIDAIGDLNLDRNWQTALEASGSGQGRIASFAGGDLDFLRPAEAQALLPSQLLEMQSGGSANRSGLFSLPFQSPFGPSTGGEGGASGFQSRPNNASPFFVQEQQRSGLLLGPPSVGKVVSSSADKLSSAPGNEAAAGGDKGQKIFAAKGTASSKEASNKFDLFADLDPFANPDAIGKQKAQSDADQI